MRDRRGVLTPPEAGFRLERHAPAPDLAGLIDFHWHVAWDLAPGAEHVQGVLPFPCVNLGAGSDGLFVHGPITRRDDRTLRGRGHALGTRIAAGLFPTIAYDNLEAHRTTDRILTFGEAFGPDGERLAVRLPDAGAPPAHRALVEDLMRRRAAARPPDPQALLANRVVVAILAEPTVARVADVAARHALSPRALQRLFRRYVGLTPKQVLQRSRLHEAVERVTAGDGTGADLAFDLGYADQAHFANAFREATGRSPSRYGRGPYTVAR
ncbi:helix-turn-helix domain-containing protein [Baekduia alba]|uniref:helix-turn-helix domain-containing protein n=1 Tax=Baekduia alba TaxID=2997333 RepID=UPI00234233EE|nr:helix-turn-helix transcriptional regulator [Baekduia alba]